MKNWMKKLLISGLLLLCICVAVTTVWMFREEARLDALQAEMLEELEAREGEYDAQKNRASGYVKKQSGASGRKTEWGAAYHLRWTLCYADIARRGHN